MAPPWLFLQWRPVTDPRGFTQPHTAGLHWDCRLSIIGGRPACMGSFPLT